MVKKIHYDPKADILYIVTKVRHYKRQDIS